MAVKSNKKVSIKNCAKHCFNHELTLVVNRKKLRNRENKVAVHSRQSSMKNVIFLLTLLFMFMTKE